MSMTTKIWTVPELAIAKQLFYVPGAFKVGGFTNGGARISSAEPGGFGFLEIQPALRLEWKRPTLSWLMSKTNGEVLRFRLAPTPQVMTGELLRGTGTPFNGIYTLNLAGVKGDAQTTCTAAALSGSATLKIDMRDYGQILQAGHLIGHDHDCYMVDEVVYGVNNEATITVRPPLRRDVAIGDAALFRPYFTGQITNGDEVRALYDAADNGHMSLGKITLAEVIL